MGTFVRLHVTDWSRRTRLMVRRVAAQRPVRADRPTYPAYLIRKPSCSLARTQAATVPMWMSSWR